MARSQLVITVNGPGEISAWLYPVTVALKRAQPDLWIGVCLLPCVFSSGAETEVLAGFDTVDAVCSVRDSYGIILRGRKPPGFDPDAPVRMLHLGGEVVLSLLIARRLGARIDAYAEGVPQWRGFFDRVFYSGLHALPEKEAARVASEVVGELMVDAADMRRAGVPERDGRTRIALFPGSRLYMVEHFLPYLAHLVDQMTEDDPSLSWVMAQAQFISDDVLRNVPPPRVNAEWQASAVRFGIDAAGKFIETARGNRIDVRPSPQVMAMSDYAVSLPGTNTGEMAAIGLPMVVALPTYTAEDAPLPGLAGHVGGIPLIGKPLKRMLAGQALKRLPLLALPNRRAGRMLVPELAGPVSQDQIAAELRRLMAQDRAALSADLRAAMGGQGAADRIATAVLDAYSAVAAKPA